MIRLNRMRLDEARKALAEAGSAVDAIDEALRDLEASVIREQQAALDPEIASSYAAFAQAAIRRRAGLRNEREKADRIVEERRAALQLLFEELKKFEIVAGREAERARLERERRETAMFDETALRRHINAGD